MIQSLRSFVRQFYHVFKSKDRGTTCEVSTEGKRSEKKSINQGSSRNLRGDPIVETRVVYEDVSSNSSDGDRSVCSECLKKHCLRIQADTLCFTCETYLCTSCDCNHYDKISITNEPDENNKVIENLLESIMNEPEADDELYKVNVDVVERIYVKHQMDTSFSKITGVCFLLDNRIAVIDHPNAAVKVFRENKLQIYLRLSTKPFDSTEIDNNFVRCLFENDSELSTSQFVNENSKLAITCPDAQVVLLLELASSHQSIITQIEVDANCYGVDFENSQLYVLCNHSQGANCYSVLLINERGEKSKLVNDVVSSFTLTAFFITGNKKISSFDIFENIEYLNRDIDCIATFKNILRKQLFKTTQDHEDTEEDIHIAPIYEFHNSSSQTVNLIALSKYFGSMRCRKVLCMHWDPLNGNEKLFYPPISYILSPPFSNIVTLFKVT